MEAKLTYEFKTEVDGKIGSYTVVTTGRLKPLTKALHKISVWRVKRFIKLTDRLNNGGLL